MFINYEKLVKKVLSIFLFSTTTVESLLLLVVNPQPIRNKKFKVGFKYDLIGLPTYSHT